MEHLKNITNGFCSLFSAITEPRSYQPIRNGFQLDRENLQSDVNNVMQTLNRNTQKVYRQYGSQTR